MNRKLKLKLKLKPQTLRNLTTVTLREVRGGAPKSAIPCFPTDSEVAGGCTVTDTTCDCTGGASFLLC